MSDYIKETLPNGLWAHRRRTPEEKRNHDLMRKWQHRSYAERKGRTALNRVVSVIDYLQVRSARGGQSD